MRRMACDVPGMKLGASFDVGQPGQYPAQAGPTGQVLVPLPRRGGG